MAWGVHVFLVRCISCGKVPYQATSRMVLREHLATGAEITHYCPICDTSWPADDVTRALLASQIGVRIGAP